jgi:nicotinamidase-related amidase
LLAPITTRVCQLCGISALQRLFKEHFQSFADQYEAKYARKSSRAGRLDYVILQPGQSYDDRRPGALHGLVALVAHGDVRVRGVPLGEAVGVTFAPRGSSGSCRQPLGPGGNRSGDIAENPGLVLQSTWRIDMEKAAVPFGLDVSKTALVIVDMQNDFVRVGAPLELPLCRAAIPNVKKVLDACRKRGMPIVFLKFIGGPKKTLIWTWSPQLLPDQKCCWKNHRRFYKDIKKEAGASDIIEELSSEADDLFVEKYSYGGFYDTNLHTILQAHQIEYLVVVGCATPICVDDTVTGAFDRQYKVCLVSDATGSFSEEFHSNSLKRIAMKYGRVLTTAELLDELRASRS